MSLRCSLLIAVLPFAASFFGLLLVPACSDGSETSDPRPDAAAELDASISLVDGGTGDDAAADAAPDHTDAVPDGDLPVEAGAPGELDVGFGERGVVSAATPVQSLLVLRDNRIVTASFSGGRLQISRYLERGQLDSSFGAEGSYTQDLSGVGQLLNVVELPNGELLAVGWHAVDGDSRRSLLLVRLIAAGKEHDGFGSHGVAVFGELRFDFSTGPTAQHANAAAAAADGTILVAGWAESNDRSWRRPLLVRVTADGKAIEGTAKLLTLGNGEATALALLPSGKILAGGWDDLGFFVRRLKSDLTPDTFGNEGVARVPPKQFGARDIATSMGLDAQRRIVLMGICGQFVGDWSGPACETRFTAEGQPDVTFTPTGRAGYGSFSEAPRAILDARGRAVFAGSGRFGDLLYPEQIYTLRGSASGAIDTTFGDSGMTQLTIGRPGTVVTASGVTLALQSDDRIVIGSYLHSSSGADGGPAGQHVLLRLWN